MNILIWGTGGSATKFIKLLNKNKIHIIGFCDNDLSKGRNIMLGGGRISGLRTT